jgi:hypothetical protein
LGGISSSISGNLSTERARKSRNRYVARRVATTPKSDGNERLLPARATTADASDYCRRDRLLPTLAPTMGLLLLRRAPTMGMLLLHSRLLPTRAPTTILLLSRSRLLRPFFCCFARAARQRAGRQQPPLFAIASLAHSLTPKSTLRLTAPQLPRPESAGRA